MVVRAGQDRPMLLGAGSLLWKGLPGAKTCGVANRIRRLLPGNPTPTTLIMHLGTNDIFYDTTKVIRDRVKNTLVEVSEFGQTY